MTLRDRIRPYVPLPLLQAKRRVLTEVNLWRSLRKLKGLGRAGTASEAYRMAGEFRGHGEFAAIVAMQDEQECCRLLDFLIAEKPRVVCEIGSYLGGVLFMMTRILPGDATLISVDYPGATKELPYPATRKRFHESFGLEGQHVSVLYGDSHKQSTVVALQGMLAGRQIDFLLIDGDHSLEGVEADFHNYSPLVRDGGVIAFHDIVAHPEFGVEPLWQRLKKQHETDEFVSPASLKAQHGYGIGVLRWHGAGR